MTRNSLLRRISLALLIWASHTLFPAFAEETANPLEKRWVKVDINAFVSEEVDRAISVIQRAHAAGYNGVVLSDTKTDFYHSIDSSRHWITEFRKPMAIAESLGMETVIGALPFGYATGLLANDVNLAAGHPLVDVPMRAENGRLEPVQTAQVRNGGFESFDLGSNRFSDFTIDSPGTGSFVDRSVVKEGAASLRFENIGNANEHGNGRVFQTFAVKPFQQYRLRIAIRAENLSADDLAIQIWHPQTGQRIQWQFVEVPNGNGDYERVSSPDNWTTNGWLEQEFVFNSLNSSEVEIILGMWHGTTGKLWWDDLRVDPEPTLNVIRRDDLPVTVKSQAGSAYLEGQDFAPIIDRELGDDDYVGDFGWRHSGPPIAILPGSSIQNGETVLLSAYHALPVFGDQVGASLLTPGVLELVDTIVESVARDLSPTAYFFRHDEMRSGGWEPSATRFPSTGAALAEHLRYAHQSVKTKGGDRPVYIWSDMIDPYGNAIEHFFAVNNTLAGSWEGLSPETVVVNWNYDKPVESLTFFDALGNGQIIAAYYDEDVERNAQAWIDAVNTANVGGRIKGVMYTTWSDSYEDLEAFAQRWWSSPVFSAATAETEPQSVESAEPVSSEVALHLPLSGSVDDISGNGHHGQLGNGVEFAGRGVQTTGASGSHVSIPHASELNLGSGDGDFSVSFWVNLQEGPTGSWRGFAKKGDSWDERGFALYLPPDGNHVNYAVTTSLSFNESAEMNAPLIVGEWTHLTMIKSGREVRMFVNGAFDSSFTLQAASIGNSGRFYFGDAPDDSNATAAIFDDVRVYSSPLASSEVGELAQSAPPENLMPVSGLPALIPAPQPEPQSEAAPAPQPTPVPEQPVFVITAPVINPEPVPVPAPVLPVFDAAPFAGRYSVLLAMPENADPGLGDGFGSLILGEDGVGDLEITLPDGMQLVLPLELSAEGLEIADAALYGTVRWVDRDGIADFDGFLQWTDTAGEVWELTALGSRLESSERFAVKMRVWVQGNDFNEKRGCSWRKNQVQIRSRNINARVEPETGFVSGTFKARSGEFLQIEGVIFPDQKIIGGLFRRSDGTVGGQMQIFPR